MKESRRGQYDLEDRTFAFSAKIRAFVKQLPNTMGNIEDIKQLVRASGSVGANYIEANESLSKERFSVENQNLPQGGQGKPLLVAAN
jgi:hypothetical protein